MLSAPAHIISTSTCQGSDIFNDLYLSLDNFIFAFHLKFSSYLIEKKKNILLILSTPHNQKKSRGGKLCQTRPTEALQEVWRDYLSITLLATNTLTRHYTRPLQNSINTQAWHIRSRILQNTYWYLSYMQVFSEFVRKIGLSILAICFTWDTK